MKFYIWIKNNLEHNPENAQHNPNTAPLYRPIYTGSTNVPNSLKNKVLPIQPGICFYKHPLEKTSIVQWNQILQYLIQKSQHH